MGPMPPAILLIDMDAFHTRHAHTTGKQVDGRGTLPVVGGLSRALVMNAGGALT
jgi:hypothetical protein